MSSLWLRKLALAGATLAPTSLAFSHYTQKPTQSSTALRATPLKQCVGGSWVESSSKATIDVEDPTTGALIGKVPEGTAADAHAALVAAKEAQPAWAKTAPAARGEALKAMARVIRANRVELAELLASEQAKVAGLAQVEIDFTAVWILRPVRGLRLTTGAAMACRWDRHRLHAIEAARCRYRDGSVPRRSTSTTTRAGRASTRRGK